MLKKRDTKYTNGIVTQQFIESVGWLGERSHSECDSTKNVRHLGFQPGGLCGFVTSRQTLASNGTARPSAVSAIGPTAAPIPSVSDGSAEHDEPVYAAGRTADAWSGAGGERSWWSGDGWSDRYSWDRVGRSPGHACSRNAGSTSVDRRRPLWRHHLARNVASSF